jgi:hypothetical protein
LSIIARDCINAKSARIRLADLEHEVNTPHVGRYLDKPLAQQAVSGALNRLFVYDLAAAVQTAR